MSSYILSTKSLDKAHRPCYFVETIRYCTTHQLPTVYVIEFVDNIIICTFTIQRPKSLAIPLQIQNGICDLYYNAQILSSAVHTIVEQDQYNSGLLRLDSGTHFQKTNNSTSDDGVWMMVFDNAFYYYSGWELFTKICSNFRYDGCL